MLKEDKKFFIREESIIHKKVFLYLETELDGDCFKNSQKMVSFFGQVGIYENTEKLLEMISWFYKPLYINYFTFNETSDVKDSENVYDEEKDSDDFDYNDNLNNRQKNVLFFKDETNALESKEQELDNVEKDLNQADNEKLETEENGIDEICFKFILPLVMVFYRNDRKMDYYPAEEYNNNYFFKKKITQVKEYLVSKKLSIKSFISKKANICYNYVKHKSKNFSYAVKNSNVVFLFKDFLKYHLFNRKKKKKKKKKRKLSFFKNFKLKKLNKIIFFIKNYKWLGVFYPFMILNIKLLSFSKEYSHKSYLSQALHLFSQNNNIKYKILKRYRRRRRYKRKITRNFFGKKLTLKRFINILEELKKKRRK